MFDSRQLEQLVSEQRFDELFRLVSLADVAAAWMRYQRRLHRGETIEMHDPDRWAIDVWEYDASWADEAQLRDGVLELVAAAETKSDCGAIGAWVLEYCITADEDRLQWIEAQAAASDKFRQSLANVYVWGRLPDTVAARVEAAACVRLSRPFYWKWLPHRRRT